MTYKEAHDLCDKYTIDFGLGVESVLNTSTFLLLSQKSLGKQIPIKPIGENNVCPKCGVIEFGFNKPNYCENCGQKLDWSDWE